MTDKPKPTTEALHRQIEQLQVESQRLQARLLREQTQGELRSEVWTMRNPKDLLKVILKMFAQMRSLGIETPVSSIFFINEEEGVLFAYTAAENMRQFDISWTNPMLIEIDAETVAVNYELPLDQMWEAEVSHWRKGETWIERRNLEEDLAGAEAIHKFLGLSKPPPWMGPEWKQTGIPFKDGWVMVRHRGELAEADLNLVLTFTEALSMGYMRYQDFRHLEAQNQSLQEALRALREAQHQLVLQEKIASLGHHPARTQYAHRRD